MKKLFGKLESTLEMGKPSAVAGGALMGLALFIALFTATFSGCGGEKRSAPAPNIILITIDALRADHLSCYGYERKTSPFIDSIAEQGTLFANAYSTSSWTSPSMASIFTSLYPRSHGVLHGFVAGEGRIANQEVLSSKLKTIAEILRDANYETFGASSNGHMSSETGFDQGFDYFTTLWFKSSPDPNEAAKEWEEKVKSAAKYFFWIHYFDPHAPYVAREPWITTYSDGEKAYRKWSGMPMKKIQGQLSKIKSEPYTKKALIDLYDSEINYCDHYVKALFEMLPLGKNSLIIISADHGEEFLDHGGLEHGKTLYEEVIRVPLIIKLPDKSYIRDKIDQPVSNKDIFPTILDAAGIDLPSEIEGKSLLPLLAGEAKETRDPIYTELDRGSHWEAIRQSNWKFIFRGRKKRERFLYDLATDPGETKNLVGDKPEIAQQLEINLDNWINAHPVFIPPKIDKPLEKEQEEKLRSLGYLK